MTERETTMRRLPLLAILLLAGCSSNDGTTRNFALVRDAPPQSVTAARMPLWAPPSLADRPTRAGALVPGRNAPATDQVVGSQGQDVVIRQEKGGVQIDLSDSLLFSGDTTSYTVSEKASPVLARLAKVLNNLPDIEFMVEGHTDSIPYAQGPLFDNWDLSVKRAASVVRILQSQYNVSPARMTAAGRSEYITVAPNDTPEGQAANRRTRIIILPQLDQLINLLGRRPGQTAPAMPVAPSEPASTAAPASSGS